MEHKIAIPVTDGILSSHFGHCEKFAIYSITDGIIINQELIIPPPHEPGSHPKFLSDLGCSVIIAGGMGERAQNLFAENNIKVLVGVADLPLEALVHKYIAGELQSGTNRCDH